MLNEFALSLRMGDAKLAIESAHLLESMVDGSHPAITEFMDRAKQNARTTWGALTTECVSLLPTIRGKLPAIARRITDGYALQVR